MLKWKQVLILGLFINVSIFFTTNVFGQLDPLKSVDDSGISEATLSAINLNADAQIAKADPKKAFTNLFENNSNTAAVNLNGIKTEHLNPQAMSFVQDYIVRHADDLYELQQTARPYFDMMDDVLTQNGIPKELKYLAVIESFLKASARSWAGAVGPWQFMPATARGLGLNVNGFRDERKDYLKSTVAASKYLNYLYGLYKDWLLVIAAYNCGPGRVNTAIARAGSNNFWNLQYYLPTESRNHVKKFIATHYIMEGQGGPTTVGKDKQILFANNTKTNTETIANDESSNQTVKVQTIEGRYNSKAIAKYLEMPLADFTKMNPSLDRVLASNSTYQLKLPLDKADLFSKKKNEMLNESIQMLLNPDYRN